ncbi:MAG: CBS domain-containing protein, partial [Clostridiales bacterium]|nr:CBS domain-containing protein [Clostridiales bacterium]
MFVRDKMTKDVVTISISDPLTKAQRLMQQNDFHHLPVLSGKKLTGVLSDSDIEYYLSDNSGADTKDLTVKDVLPPNKRCVTIAPNVSIEQAVMLLQNNKSGCLPVVEGESMVGIITLSDVLNTFIDLLWAKRSRITVELGPAPGLIADVADVISSFGVSILRIVMFPKGENFEALLSLDTD